MQAAGDAGQMVTFAVTLPGASANSLVVTQPNSQSVHEQVAGWFTTQMASRGNHSVHGALLVSCARAAHVAAQLLNRTAIRQGRNRSYASHQISMAALPPRVSMAPLHYQ